MGKKPEEPPQRPQPQGGDRDKVPPFNPDPRLAAYLEGGRKSDAEKRFRQAIKKREKEREKVRYPASAPPKEGFTPR